jgi:hypothetical protein
MITKVNQELVFATRGIRLLGVKLQHVALHQMLAFPSAL